MLSVGGHAITAQSATVTAVGEAFTVNYSVGALSGDGVISSWSMPTGNVTVSDGVNSCSGTVAAGACNLALATVGTRTLTATYGGDTNFNGSSGTSWASVFAPHALNPQPGLLVSVNNDAEFDYPYGLVEFTLNCNAADVTITFPGNIVGTAYRKFGPTTPGNASTTAWYTFNSVTLNSNTSIILHLQDNVQGDDTGRTVS